LIIGPVHPIIKNANIASISFFIFLLLAFIGITHYSPVHARTREPVITPKWNTYPLDINQNAPAAK
jgi:hypothetical protein